MNRDEYNILFHKLELNLVAFKRLMDCDEEVLKLVNAAIEAERERIIAANAPEIEKVNGYIKALKDAVAAEREACAALCDKISDEDGFEGGYADRCAFAIRERGAP